MFTHISFSQNGVRVSSGEVYEIVDAQEKEYFHIDDKLISIKTNLRDNYFIQTHDPSTLNRKSFNVVEAEKGEVQEEIMKYNGDLLLFYGQWDKDNQQENLYYKEIDPETGAFQEPVRVFQGKDNKEISGTLVNSGFYNLFLKDKYQFETSFNDSRMLIQYRIKPEEANDSKNKDVIGYIVLNENLEVMWEKTLTMPYTEEKMDNIDYSVDQKGNVYLLAKVKHIEEDDYEEDEDFHIELLRLDQEDDEFQKVSIDLRKNGVQPRSSLIHESGKGGVWFCGFYKVETKEENKGGLFSSDKGYQTEGLFAMHIDGQGNPGELHKHEFSTKTLKQYISERDARKIQKAIDEEERVGIPDLKLKKVISYDNGELVLIGEQVDITSHTSVDTEGNMNTSYDHEYDNR